MRSGTDRHLLFDFNIERLVRGDRALLAGLCAVSCVSRAQAPWESGNVTEGVFSRTPPTRPGGGVDGDGVFSMTLDMTGVSASLVLTTGLSRGEE